MNGRITKLLKAYCIHYKKPYLIYRERYKRLDKKQKAYLKEMLIKSLPIVN